MEEVLRNHRDGPDAFSESTGNPIIFGTTSTGKRIAVVYVDASDSDSIIIYPLTAYPVPESELQPDPAAHRDAREILGPFKLRAADGGVLSFFGTFAIFDTPFEVTTSELAIELLFPADRATAEALERRAREQGAG